MNKKERVLARAELYEKYRKEKYEIVQRHKKELFDLTLKLKDALDVLMHGRSADPVRPVGRPPTTSEGPFYGTPRRGAHSPPARPETNKDLYAKMTEADKEKMRKYGGNPDDLLKDEDDKEDPNDAYMRKHGIDPDASAQS